MHSCSVPIGIVQVRLVLVQYFIEEVPSMVRSVLVKTFFGNILLFTLHLKYYFYYSSLTFALFFFIGSLFLSRIS